MKLSLKENNFVLIVKSTNFICIKVEYYKQLITIVVPNSISYVELENTILRSKNWIIDEYIKQERNNSHKIKAISLIDVRKLNTRLDKKWCSTIDKGTLCSSFNVDSIHSRT